MRALEHGARAEESLLPEARRLYADLRRPARVQPLGPRAFGEILDDAAGHTAGDAQCIHGLPAVQTHRHTHCQCRRHRAQHTGRMESRFVDRLGNYHRQPAQRFDAHHDAFERRFSIAAEALAGGEHGRHDDRAGMHRAAFKSVIEIFAVRGAAVDHRRDFGGVGGFVADGGGRPATIDTRQQGLDVIGVACRHTQAYNVDQQLFYARAYGSGNCIDVER